MSRKAWGYIWLVILAGLPLGLVCSVRFVRHMFSAGSWDLIYETIWLIGLCALCRSFPIYMRDNQALDLTVISILTTYLICGVDAAVFVYLASAFFAFERNPHTHKTITIYNTSLVKTLFNNCNIVIAIIVPAFICQLTGRETGDMAFPSVFFTAMLFMAITFLINSLIALTMFILNGDMEFREIWLTLVSLLPNVLAAAPMGLIIAVLFNVPYGNYLVFLMIAPLMLARYAWRMYLESRDKQKKLIAGFISVIEARDVYTQGHSERVRDYSVRIGRELRLSEKNIELISEGAVLHDIGKVGVDDDILRKPGRLSDDEFAEMKKHPMTGAAIIQHVGLNSAVSDMIRYHHERFDGKGYPASLAGNDIPLYARILCVADSFDAMTSDRPYRKGMSVERAEDILRDESGRQFDPEVVTAFLKALENKK